MYSNINQFEIKVFTRCIYDERVAPILFNETGICNYCLQIDGVTKQYGKSQPKGEALQATIFEQFMCVGRRKRCDFITRVSGGIIQSVLDSFLIRSYFYLGLNVVISKGISIGGGYMIGVNSLVNWTFLKIIRLMAPQHVLADA
jgi:hypothetical protein